MKSIIYILTLSFVTLLLSCNGQKKLDSKEKSNQDTLHERKSDAVKRNPVDFVANYNGEYNKLFVFVGKKISVDTLPFKEYSMDNGFVGKYVVMQKVFGDFSHDTIEFVAYDHYGTPPFSDFENVLLFVLADSGTYYHEKYMYNDVYLTKDGRWAGSYPISDYRHSFNQNTKVKPVKIDFKQEVSYPAFYFNKYGKSILKGYPQPYFKIVDDRAVAIYGNYVDELFILKRDGYLTARKIFKDGKLY